MVAQDVYWWTKGKGDDANAMQTELEAVKEREAELMAEVCAYLPAAGHPCSLILLFHQFYAGV